MKRILTLMAVCAASPVVHAQLVVTDPISDVLNQAFHIEDIAKQIEIIQNQVEQINTLTKQLQQVQAYVKAFGDPEKLTSIVGADRLMTSLRQTGVGQTLDTVRSSATGADALRYDANGLYRSIGTKFTTPNGAQLPRAEDVYRKFGAIQQSSLNLQSVTTDVSTRRDALRQQIATTTQRLQSATTDAETQKLAGVLIGYNAELGAVDREIEHAATQLAAQDIENRADQERQNTARREERRAQIEEGFRRSGEAFRLDTSAPTFPRR
jgi:hypothetical protein